MVKRLFLGFGVLAARCLDNMAMWPGDWRPRRPVHERHIAHALGGEDVDVYTDDTRRRYPPGGQFLVAVRTRAIPAGVCTLALPALRRAAKVSTARGGRESGTIGFVGPDHHDPFARPSAFWRDDHEGRRDVTPFIQALDQVLKDAFPGRHSWQREAVETSPDFHIRGTAFNTGTVNRDAAFPAHVDDSNLAGSLSVMSVIRSGVFGGGLLTFPRWGLGVDLRSRDVLIFDPFEVHGNTAMYGGAGGAERISAIVYASDNLIGRGTAEDELARVRRASD